LFIRETLSIYGCDREFRKAFPQDPNQRKDFYEVYAVDPFLSSSYSVYAEPAVRLTSISTNCQKYLNMGCAFVAKIDSSKLAAGVWLKYLRDNKEKIKDNYLQHIERIVEFVSEYTGVHSCMQILAIFSS
jgi:hypothetical protein